MSESPPSDPNQYWCKRCEGNTEPNQTVIKKYYGGESGPSDKIIHKCRACGLREMYIPMKEKKNSQESLKATAWLLGIGVLLLLADYVFFSFQFNDLKSGAILCGGLSFCFLMHAAWSHSKWSVWDRSEKQRLTSNVS